MTSDFSIEYFDVLILYHEDDRKDAVSFRDHLRDDIYIGEGIDVKAVLYDDPDTKLVSGLKIQNLEKAFERSNYTFVFLSENFLKSNWMLFISHTCLTESIENEEKKWCVVPVISKAPNEKFKIPMAFNAITSLDYYRNDNIYKKKVTCLIKEKLKRRLELQEEFKQRVEKKRWAKKHSVAIQDQSLVKKTETLTLKEDFQQPVSNKTNVVKPGSGFNFEQRQRQGNVFLPLC